MKRQDGRTEVADREPDAGGEDGAKRIAALQEGAATAARVVGPKLGHDRGAGRPFRADREADQKAQNGKGNPVPRERAQAGEHRVGEDREDHGALAAEIIGEHAAQHATDPPAQHGGGDDHAGVGRNQWILARVEQLPQRSSDSKDQGENLEAVERPAEVRGEERFPMHAVERAIPRQGPDRAGFPHQTLLCEDLVDLAG
jgi:hypothetical protein